VRALPLHLYILTVGLVVAGCSGTDTSTPPAVGGNNGVGGSTGNGGTSALGQGGGAKTGGAPGTGGSMPATGGTLATNTGGMPGAGGARTGGAPGTGGSMPATGGTLATNTGGMPGTGGARTGGAPGTGGARTGGAPGTGGTITTSSGPNCSGAALSGGTQTCSTNQTGTSGSFGWSIWSTQSGGCITPHGGGTAALKATWNNAGDFLAREGCSWNETKTYDKYGDITADYAYTKSGSAGGYSYIGIYGWSNTPLIEFYIVDDWFGSGPPSGGGTQVGSFTVDGGTYKVLKHQQVNQPSIHGTQTFWQYFSVRQTARQCGHIDVSAHFKEWASLGLNLGVLNEAKLVIEAGGGSGSIDYSAGAMACN